MKIKWIGNAFFTVKTQDKFLYLDPWVKENSGVTMTLEEAAAMGPTHVLVSHGHPGHYGRGDSVAIANLAKAPYISTREVIRYTQEKGLLKTNYLGLAPGSRILLDDMELELIHVKHPPEPPIAPQFADLPGDPNAIWLIKLDGKTLLHVGDTTDDPAFDRISAENKNIDVAMLPLWGKGMAGDVDTAISTLVSLLHKLRPRVVLLHNRWDPQRPAYNTFVECTASMKFESEILPQQIGTEIEI
jgi:L-ascorbate metabolism protein UlaG (beta-lactamase superfamily)